MLVWKPVKDYENYMINNLGQVKSVARMGTPERILKPHYVKGYVQYELLKDGKRKGFKAHRLVAEAFIPNPDNKKEINHINGNKHDNSVFNLEWCTTSENQLHSHYVLRKGIVKVKQYSLDNKLIKVWDSIKEASKNLNIDATSITKVCRNNRHSAGGYLWTY